MRFVRQVLLLAILLGLLSTLALAGAAARRRMRHRDTEPHEEDYAEGNDRRMAQS